MFTDEMASFQVRVRPSLAGATDFYILIDFSASMRNHLDVLKLTSSVGVLFIF